MVLQVFEKFYKWIFPPAAFILSIRPYEEITHYVIVSAAIIALAVFFLNRYFLKRFDPDERPDKYFSLIVPTLFLVGMFGTLATISNPALKAAIAAVSVLIFGRYNLKFLRNQNKSDQDIFTLAGIFLTLNFLWGVGFYFTFPWWISTLLTFVIFFGVFWSFFSRWDMENREVLLWTLICSLIVVEVSWAVLFWPVHYLTAAVLPFAVFYLVYILSGLYFEHRLTSNKIYFQTSIIIIVVVLSLLSSSWQL